MEPAEITHPDPVSIINYDPTLITYVAAATNNVNISISVTVAMETTSIGSSNGITFARKNNQADNRTVQEVLKEKKVALRMLLYHQMALIGKTCCE